MEEKKTEFKTHTTSALRRLTSANSSSGPPKLLMSAICEVGNNCN